MFSTTMELKIKLEINSRMISENFPNIWELNNMLLNVPWVKVETKREIMWVELK